MNELDILLEHPGVVVAYLCLARWPVIPTAVAMRRDDIRAHIVAVMWRTNMVPRLDAAAERAGLVLKWVVPGSWTQLRECQSISQKPVKPRRKRHE